MAFSLGFRRPVPFPVHVKTTRRLVTIISRLIGDLRPAADILEHGGGPGEIFPSAGRPKFQPVRHQDLCRLIFFAEQNVEAFGNFRRMLRKAGLARIRLHDLRHSYATLEIAAGVSPDVVQESLGHAWIATDPGSIRGRNAQLSTGGG